MQEGMSQLSEWVLLVKVCSLDSSASTLKMILRIHRYPPELVLKLFIRINRLH